MKEGFKIKGSPAIRILPLMATIAVLGNGAPLLADEMAQFTGADNYNINATPLSPGQPTSGLWSWSNLSLARTHEFTDFEVPGAPAGGEAFSPAAHDLVDAAAVTATSFAITGSSFQVNANGNTRQAIGGTAEIIGTAGHARTFAGSDVFMASEVANSKGTVKFTPTLNVTSLTGKVRTEDTIGLALNNFDDNTTQTATLWDAGVSFNGPGTLSWANGAINLTGFTGTFFVTLKDPAITSGKGKMLLKFQNGLVTKSRDSGIFDGLLPLVGAPATMDIPFGDLSGQLAVKYNFHETSATGFGLLSDFTMQGEARVNQVPDAGSFAPIYGLLGGLLVWATRKNRKA